MAARQLAHRARCAAAIRDLPSGVLGPVESPPWQRQRRLPGSTLSRQGVPFRVLAPQQGRSLSRSGDPSPASPSSAIRLHQAPMPQAGSEHVLWRSAGHPIQPCRCQSIQLSLVTRGGGGLASAASIGTWPSTSSGCRAVVRLIDVKFCKPPTNTPSRARAAMSHTSQNPKKR